MNNSYESNFGSHFERVLVAILTLVTGVLLMYLAAIGPAFLGLIKYKTAPIINNQIIGQDLVNLFILGPLSILSGILLLMKKQLSKYLLIITPLYLIYFVLTYILGIEWISTVYSGNSEQYFFHFLFILISSLVILMYSILIFPKNVVPKFNKKGLKIYSVLIILFLSMFALMWTKEVVEVLQTGTTRGYDLAPASFWNIRCFDMGFSIPLGFISVYLLWARPKESYPVQIMFYGFFITMICAVNAMSITMLLNNDPLFTIEGMVLFSALALIVFSGFIYILRHYKVESEKNL